MTLRTQDEWNEDVKALEEIHAEDDGAIFKEWAADRERFIRDVMELAQAAYCGGYEDAIEGVQKAGDAMTLAAVESLTYIDPRYF